MDTKSHWIVYIIGLCLTTANQGAQKNRNGKTIAVLFQNAFYYSSA
jgi:hypothetical protein